MVGKGREIPSLSQKANLPVLRIASRNFNLLLSLLQATCQFKIIQKKKSIKTLGTDYKWEVQEHKIKEKVQTKRLIKRI